MKTSLPFLKSISLSFLFIFLVACADNGGEETNAQNSEPAEPEETAETNEAAENDEASEPEETAREEEEELMTLAWMPDLQEGDQLVFRFHHSFPNSEELDELYADSYPLVQTVESWEEMDDEEILMTILFEEDGPHGFLEGKSHYRISPAGFVLLQEGLVDGGSGHYIPGSLLLPGRFSGEEPVTHRTRILERVRGEERNLKDSRTISLIGEETVEVSAGEFAGSLKIGGEGEVETEEGVESYTFTEWFAPGLGLVKGEWSSEDEIFEFELESFTVE